VPAWELENVEDAARANPRSFFVPSLEERRSQSVGDEVRLHFLPTDPGPDLPRAERMWVQIVEREGTPPRYVGTLQNQPTAITGLDVGARIPFGPEHIAQTFIRKSDPRWFEGAEERAIVSTMVFQEGETIRWMYREPPDGSEDSGWRLFTGHETQEYLDDSKNARLCVIAWLLDFDPTLMPAMRGGVGSAFERDSVDAPWREVKDWTPQE
jgi:hypothetical protein